MHRDVENIDNQGYDAGVHADIEDLLPLDLSAHERLSRHLGDTVGVDQDVIRKQEDRSIQQGFLSVGRFDDRKAHETDVGKDGHEPVGRDARFLHLQQMRDHKCQEDQAGIQYDCDQRDLQELRFIGAGVVRRRGGKDQTGVRDIDHESGNMLCGSVVQEFDLVAYKTDGHNDEQDRHLN